MLAMAAKKSYRLQPVLDMRDRARQEAAQRVASLRLQVAEAEQELARREQEVLDCRARQEAARQQMLSEAAGGTEARHMVAYRAHIADLRSLEAELQERVTQQEAVLARVRGELDNALVALIEASREVQVIEKHKEGWQEQTRRTEQRREQKLSDEIGSIMHEQRRRGES